MALRLPVTVITRATARVAPTNYEDERVDPPLLDSCSVETWGFEATLGLRNSWSLQNMSLAADDPLLGHGDEIGDVYDIVVVEVVRRHVSAERACH